MKKLIIAIDGYSATGKSTTARLVAKQLDYTFIDTGAMYRAVTYFFQKNAVPVEQESPQLLEALGRIHLDFRLNPETGNRDMFLNGENVESAIRSMEVSSKVSEVSAISAVRKKLVEQQQQMGRAGGVVMDGRDIGTVVFPDADLKIFLTADMKVRVHRRMLELEKKGKSSTAREVEENIRHRDQIDTTRDDSPLKKAENAIEIDTSDLTIPEQTSLVVEMAKKLM